MATLLGPTSNDLPTALKDLVIDIARRFSYKTAPQSVSDFHASPPVEVSKDSQFDCDNEGSVSDDLTYVTFDIPFGSEGSARLMYVFAEREYSFYAGDDIRTKGLRSVMPILDSQVTRKQVHEGFGKPDERTVSDDFRTVEHWNLPTPKSGGRLPERFSAIYEATNPEVVNFMMISFPEHL